MTIAISASVVMKRPATNPSTNSAPRCSLNQAPLQRLHTSRCAPSADVSTDVGSKWSAKDAVCQVVVGME